VVPEVSDRTIAPQHSCSTLPYCCNPKSTVSIDRQNRAKEIDGLSTHQLPIKSRTQTWLLPGSDPNFEPESTCATSSLKWVSQAPRHRLHVKSIASSRAICAAVMRGFVSLFFSSILGTAVPVPVPICTSTAVLYEYCPSAPKSTYSPVSKSRLMSTFAPSLQPAAGSRSGIV
jgi:hypothetical protein